MKSTIDWSSNYALNTIPNEICVKGLSILLEHWNDGFPDVKHTISSASKGLLGEQVQEGDVFQRAIIAEIIIQICKMYPAKLESYIDSETAYLVNKRSKEFGWKYFPDFIYQPNDADTTAQVLQVVFEANRLSNYSSYFENTIKRVVDRADEGIVKTWILDEANEDTLKLERYFLTYWAKGDSVDVDVIANFLFAINKVYSKSYQELYDNSLLHILDNQNRDGSFSSTWYVGPYYGTYVVVRLLTELRVHIPAVGRCIGYILSMQNDDGSWGQSENVNLNTALALLSLMHSYELMDEHHELIELSVYRGVKKLISAFHDTICWGSEPFFKAEASSMQSVIQGTLLFYSSDITTAYCSYAIAKAVKMNFYKS